MLFSYKKIVLSVLLVFGFIAAPSVEAVEPLTCAVVGSCLVSGALGLERVYTLLTKYYENASYGETRDYAKRLIDLGEQKNFFACCALSEAEYNNWCDDHDGEVKQASFVMTQKDFVLVCKREFAQNVNPLLRAHEVLKEYWIDCASLNGVLAKKSAFFESKGLPLGEIQARLNKIMNRVRRNMQVIEQVLGIGAEEFREKEEVLESKETQKIALASEPNTQNIDDQTVESQETEEPEISQEEDSL